jgi:hypothetical protein
MPEIRVAIYDDNGWRGPDRVYHLSAVQGYWTYNYTLPGYFYNTSQYVHNWYFWGWRASYNWNGSSYPYRMEIDYGAAYGNNNNPTLGDDQRYTPGSSVTLFMWNGEMWDFYFAITDKTGVSYTVYYNGNATGVGGGVGQNSPQYGSNFWLQGNGFSLTGHDFAGWYLDINGATYGSGAYYGVWYYTSNATAYATWSQKYYTVFYNANATGVGGSVSNNSPRYANNFWLQANGFTRTGYNFAGWYLDINGATYGSGAYYGVWYNTSNATAYAQWTIIQYTVTFNNNGYGTGKTVTQNYNTTITCPTLKAVGYVFGGWATSASSTTQNKAGGATFTLGAGNENYFAIWTVNTNNVVRFSELQTVYGGTNPISLSEYRTQSGQTTANSKISLSANLKGKGPVP